LANANVITSVVLASFGVKKTKTIALAALPPDGLQPVFYEARCARELDANDRRHGEEPKGVVKRDPSLTVPACLDRPVCARLVALHAFQSGNDVLARRIREFVQGVAIEGKLSRPSQTSSRWPTD
jgi:hypothetical protein